MLLSLYRSYVAFSFGADVNHLAFHQTSAEKTMMQRLFCSSVIYLALSLSFLSDAIEKSMDGGRNFFLENLLSNC